MGTGRGKEGWARVSSSETTATRRHTVNGGGVWVPKEVDLAHASFSCLQKYDHMFARLVQRGTIILACAVLSLPYPKKNFFLITNNYLLQI